MSFCKQKYYVMCNSNNRYNQITLATLLAPSLERQLSKLCVRFFKMNLLWIYSLKNKMMDVM